MRQIKKRERGLEREREWVNMAGLRLLSLDRSACKVSPRPVPRNLDFGRVPFISRIDKNGSMCKQYFLYLILVFLLGVWNFGTSQAEVPTWPATNKILAHWVTNEFPWWTIFHMWYHNSLLEEISAPCVTPLEEDFWKPVTGLPLEFTPCAFSISWHCFTSFDCDKSQPWAQRLLSSASPPSESPYLAVLFETPDTDDN